MSASPDTDTDGREVVVVGAGPVGMSAALALRARNVPVRILEADPEDRERPGSRAIYVHGTTLRTLERNRPGLGQTLADAGLVWPTRITRWRGKEVFSRTYPDAGGSEGLPHFTSLPQVDTERFLLDALEEADVPIEWDSTVETVETSPDGVHLETEGGDVYETDYVVGADGAGSEVRHEIGAEFEGSQSDHFYLIVDVEEHPDDPRPNERIFHYEHPQVGGRNVLLVPFQGGWRVDIQGKADDDPERFTEDEVVGDLVATSLGERYRDRVSWVSTYHFKQVVADSFVDEHRRALLVGEAAHLFAPFGARGMNSGIADADAAASAVALARKASEDGVARTAVEDFAAQRETAAEWNTSAAEQALEYLTGDDLTTRMKKRLAAELADYYTPAGEWLDEAPYGPRSGPPLATSTKY